LESSGVHSNGLTLARKVLLGKYDINDRIFGEKTIGEELLEPTKIYVREIMDVIKNIEVRGLANITGGGLGNLYRITKYGFSIDFLPEPQQIFKVIQELGNISNREMYRTFNMGVGFCIVVEEKDASKVIKICEKHGTKAFRIGEVVEEEGVRIEGKDVVLKY
jgi:phosphoribosylformylglycinamidine cyclo-ligase